MQCPRCSTETIEMTSDSVKVDVCMDGCSGVWFDPFEFRKMDEPHEADQNFLKKLSEGQMMPIDPEQKIDCPRCDQQPMYRRFFSVRRQVEIDECPQCAGIWLDAGELTHIYTLFNTEEERRAEARDLFHEMFGGHLQKLRDESRENLERNRRIARLIRFLCPSYYIAGDQDWGAF